MTDSVLPSSDYERYVRPRLDIERALDQLTGGPLALRLCAPLPNTPAKYCVGAGFHHGLGADASREQSGAGAGFRMKWKF